MIKLKKAFFFILGCLCLVMAYIGVITPGIPYSPFVVASAFCFARSSERMHNWIMNNKLFGPVLRNWSEKRVFPTYGNWAMFITMDISLIILWFTTYNWKLVAGVGLGMALCAVWALRFPSSPEEYDERKAAGKKIGWFK
jgi:uncharacterized membrane protein YbaN (DUF454 family)